MTKKTGVKVMGLFDKLLKNMVKGVVNTQQEQQQYKAVHIPESNISDTPEPFGYNSTWLAIYGYTPRQVISTLNLKNVTVSTWKDGITATYQYNSGKIFVSPMINDYVLVVGIDDIIVDDNMLRSVAAQFNNMCAFANQNTVEYCYWTKFLKGKLVRAYRYVGESGEVELNIGQLTPEEIQLGFDKLLSSSDDNWDQKELPDYSHVIAIAKAWSVDTLFESFNGVTTTGYLCNM